jgi:hypothetical protein
MLVLEKYVFIPADLMALLLLTRLIRLFFDNGDQLRSDGRGVLLR